MLRYFLILILPIIVYANLVYLSNHNKELALLESFDISSSFLYDPIMNDMLVKNSAMDRNRYFFKAMNEAYLFIPEIKSILTHSEVPQGFLYLAMAESNFSIKAYSKKRAAGLWQFMPGTAKRYGLKIDEYVDERRDPIKSTYAAATYLKQLHGRFGKWYLAAIAYNCGGGRLNRAINKAGSDDLAVLLDEDKKYIPKESRNYIRKIIALALIGNNEQLLLSCEYEYLLNRSNANSLQAVSLPSGESLQRVAQLIAFPLDDLQKLNRHLKYDFTPPYSDKYDIYIPYGKLSDFKQKYFKSSNTNTYKIHIVTNGDNLSYIGKKYGIPYKVIMDFNKLKNSKLKLKQKLIIPVGAYKMKEKVDAKAYHLVKKGDSLESISKAYKVSIYNIKLINQLSSSLIKIGARLKIYE